MKNKRAEAVLTNLRTHSPAWADYLRQYINRLEKKIEKLEQRNSND